jgi:hypothetical protein
MKKFVLFVFTALALETAVFGISDGLISESSGTEPESPVLAVQVPPVMPVYRIEDGLYPAPVVESLQSAMTADSENILPGLRSDFTRAVHAVAEGQLANVEAFSKWYYGYINNYVKLIKTITGSLEKYELENFERIINKGVNTGNLAAAFTRYNDMARERYVFYADELQKSRVMPDTPVIILETMTGAEFFAPFTVIQTLDNISGAFDPDTESFIDRDSIFGQALGAFGVVTQGAGIFFTTRKIFTSISSKYFGKLAVEIVVRLVGKTVLDTSGFIIGGPVGVVAGVILSEILDMGVNAGEELLFSGKLKSDIRAAILAERDRLLAAVW